MICAFEDSIMLSGVRRLCGQRPIGPSGVLDQSSARTRAPISPPPCSQSAPELAAPTLTAGPPDSAGLSTGLIASVVRPLARAPQEMARICPEIVLELFEAVSARALGCYKLAWYPCNHVLEWALTSAPGSTELRRWCHGIPPISACAALRRLRYLRDRRWRP